MKKILAAILLLSMLLSSIVGAEAAWFAISDQFSSAFDELVSMEPGETLLFVCYASCEAMRGAFDESFPQSIGIQTYKDYESKLSPDEMGMLIATTTSNLRMKYFASPENVPATAEPVATPAPTQEPAPIPSIKFGYGGAPSISIDGVGTLSFVSAGIVNNFVPRELDPNDIYSFGFEPENPEKQVFAELCFDFKYEGKQTAALFEILYDNSISAKFVADGEYEFADADWYVESSGGSRVGTNIESIQPLETRRVHVVVTLDRVFVYGLDNKQMVLQFGDESYSCAF